jgi:hypothetical protein
MRFPSISRFLFIVCASLYHSTVAAEEPISFTVTDQQAEEIGLRIWENEGKKKQEFLTWWNEDEGFASMGICHFIWYPQRDRGPYEETFPALLRFMEKQGVVLPAWLHNHPPCPWADRKEFMNQFESPQMHELRVFLFRTKNVQVQFIVDRFRNSLHGLLSTPEVKKQFLRLMALRNGPYILLDYHNFKGSGTSTTERYKGVGWGLLQVLEEMDRQNNDDPADLSFRKAAKTVLERRVANSPKERNEQRWLPGWLSRLKTYT